MSTATMTNPENTATCRYQTSRHKDTRSVRTPTCSLQAHQLFGPACSTCKYDPRYSLQPASYEGPTGREATAATRARTRPRIASFSPTPQGLSHIHPENRRLSETPAPPRLSACVTIGVHVTHQPEVRGR